MNERNFWLQRPISKPEAQSDGHLPLRSSAARKRTPGRQNLHAVPARAECPHATRKKSALVRLAGLLSSTANSTRPPAAEAERGNDRLTGLQSVGRAGKDRIGALTGRLENQTARIADEIDVVAAAAAHQVRPGAAIERVVAGIAAQGMVGCAAEDDAVRAGIGPAFSDAATMSSKPSPFTSPAEETKLPFRSSAATPSRRKGIRIWHSLAAVPAVLVGTAGLPPARAALDRVFSTRRWMARISTLSVSFRSATWLYRCRPSTYDTTKKSALVRWAGLLSRMANWIAAWEPEPSES